MRIAPAEHADDRRSVYTNDRESCAQMTEQLAALGHTRIGFVIGNPDHAAVADRYQGYRDGLRTCGVALDKKLIVQGYNSYDSGVECARKLLQVPGRSDRLRSSRATTRWRPACWRSRTDWGWRSPRTCRWSGFDDVPLASQVWPALTTIRQPIPAMAAQAAELLLRQLRGEPYDRSGHVVESALMFRQSHGPSREREATRRLVRAAAAARIR